jgi:hypothetical protein
MKKNGEIYGLYFYWIHNSCISIFCLNHQAVAARRGAVRCGAPGAARPPRAQFFFNNIFYNFLEYFCPKILPPGWQPAPAGRRAPIPRTGGPT